MRSSLASKTIHLVLPSQKFDTVKTTHVESSKRLLLYCSVRLSANTFYNYCKIHHVKNEQVSGYFWTIVCVFYMYVSFSIRYSFSTQALDRAQALNSFAPSSTDPVAYMLVTMQISARLMNYLSVCASLSRVRVPYDACPRTHESLLQNLRCLRFMLRSSNRIVPWHLLGEMLLRNF